MLWIMYTPNTLYEGKRADQLWDGFNKQIGHPTNSPILHDFLKTMPKVSDLMWLLGTQF